MTGTDESWGAIPPPALDARDSGGGVWNSNTVHHGTSAVVYRAFPSRLAGPPHPFPDIVAQADSESIKSTSIYPGLIRHFEQFQGSVWKGSRRGGGG